MKSTSSIFEDKELESMARRLKGEYTDPNGTFARARKKLLEIQAWTTPDMRKRLTSLLKQKRSMSIEESAKPNDEATLTEFVQEVGY